MSTRDTFQVYLNKLTNKLWGVVHVGAVGKKKGDVLLSYLVRPFTLAVWEHPTDPHTNYWECREIARLFSERGYAVDIINWNNTEFIPHKSYVAMIDTTQNLERISLFLQPHCKKVMHITFSRHQNSAEQTRLDNLKERRGLTLSLQRIEPESNNPAYADFLEGFGNKTVHQTFSEFNKPIHYIPISVAQMFDFPQGKDFITARNNFLFFGGGGAVLKGLDLVIDAFVELPHLHLHIVGPAAYEKEFEQTYSKELSLPNITRYPRPHIDKKGNMTIESVPFAEIANKCAALIYPSASEGTSGAVIQAMHAGVIPIVTKQTGLSESAPAVILEEPTIDSIRIQVQKISKISPEILSVMAYDAWNYAREHHTKEAFSGSYAHFIDNILHL